MYRYCRMIGMYGLCPPSTGSTRALGSRWAVLLVCLASSPGCAVTSQWLHQGFRVGPDYQRPAANVAESWIDVGDRRVVTDYVRDRQWWTAFHDLQLNELVQRTYDENLTLRAAGLRVLEAQSLRGVAAGLLWPQRQELVGDLRHLQVSPNGEPHRRMCGSASSSSA
jgi:hypothetical protein